VFVLLVIGAMTHFALDQLAVFTTGYSYPLLWPLSAYHFPAADLFQSSDRWPLLVGALAVALSVGLRRRASGRTSE
jgi:MYXO-CTERM domain-containing protein